MPGTRPFFAVCLLIAAVIVIVPLATIAPAARGAAMSPAAIRGFGVWREQGCAGCHTIYNQGGTYAPDLTHVYNQRGAAYLREFLENPGAFYPDAARIMPRLTLTVAETDDLIAWLAWVNASPPAAAVIPVIASAPLSLPLRGVPVVADAAPTSAAAETDPVSIGRALFSRAPANCATCHSLEPDVRIVGPSLAGIATRAGQRVAGQDAAAYLRNAILYPGDHLVDGYANVMAQNLGAVLRVDQVDALIAFLLTLN